MPRIINETNKTSLLSTDYFLLDNESSGTGKVSFDVLSNAVISSANIGSTYATKATTVTDVSYDSGSAVFKKTINGASYDIISIATLKQLIDTDTHYTSNLIVGSSSSSASNSTATNGNVYLNLVENNTIRSYNKITGAGSVSVTSDSSGTITITGTASGSGTVTSVATGVGLTGGSITTSGTIKAKLSSESSLGTIGTTSKLYAVGVDASGYLAVSVPWSEGSNTDTKVTQTATTTNSAYEVLFSETADNTTRTEGARKSSNLTFNPSTGALTATTFNGYTLSTASGKSVDTSITASSTSTNLPTSSAVATLISGYLPLSGGSISGTLAVAASTNYSTALVRNIIFSDTTPSGSIGNNGDVCVVYS